HPAVGPDDRRQRQRQQRGQRDLAVGVLQPQRRGRGRHQLPHRDPVALAGQPLERAGHRDVAGAVAALVPAAGPARAGRPGVDVASGYGAGAAGGAAGRPAAHGDDPSGRAGAAHPPLGPARKLSRQRQALTGRSTQTVLIGPLPSWPTSTPQSRASAATIASPRPRTSSGPASCRAGTLRPPPSETCSRTQPGSTDQLTSSTPPGSGVAYRIELPTSSLTTRVASPITVGDSPASARSAPSFRRTSPALAGVCRTVRMRSTYTSSRHVLTVSGDGSSEVSPASVLDNPAHPEVRQPGTPSDDGRAETPPCPARIGNVPRLPVVVVGRALVEPAYEPGGTTAAAAASGGRLVPGNLAGAGRFHPGRLPGDPVGRHLHPVPASGRGAVAVAPGPLGRAVALAGTGP